MRRFGVARATVASALDELERAGFVYPRRGKTFAAGIETPGHIPQVVAKGDNVRAVRLMQLLQREPKSPAYLRTTLGIASREYFTKAYLRPLMERDRNIPEGRLKVLSPKTIAAKSWSFDHCIS